MKSKINGLYTVLFIFIVYLSGILLSGKWRETMNYGDSSGYYIHTVSLFIHQDVGDYSKSLDALFKHFPKASNLLDDPFWLRETKIGKKSIKYSIGVAIMETPAFLMAHLFASINPQYDNDGWSTPYIFAVNFIQLIYLSIAFYLLYCVLIIYYNQRTTIITLVAISLGTNLFIQACFLTMAHTFQFFNFSLLIFLTHHFYRNPSLIKSILIGLTIGLIGMCRIPEIIAFLIPAFWGIYNKTTLLDRIDFLKGNYKYFLAAMISLLVMFSPQVLYWHYVSGDLIYNSYVEEGFNFLNPQIYKGWFNFKNGWLVYTPIMIFALIGAFLLKKKFPEIIVPLILFVGLNSYIHYSYYQWNYFPGLGSRPMIDSYPLLCFGLASFISLMDKKWISKLISFILIFSFILLNLFQTWQSYAGIIISERSNRAFFWESFLKTKHSKESFIAFDTSEPQPKSKKIIFDKRIFFNAFEDERYSDEKSFSGNRSFKVQTMNPDTAITFNFEEYNIEAGDNIKISFMGFVQEEHMGTSFDGLERISTAIFNDRGKQKRYRGISIQPYLGNNQYSIWDLGEPEVWDSISYFINIPKKVNGDWYFKSFIKNPSEKQFFIDDFKIELFKKK